MEALLEVGTVPDEVLLLCGRGSRPSPWWTPSLVDLPADEVADLTSAAAELLEGAGARDPATGRLTGPLGAVQEVAAAATVLLLMETASGGHVVRRSLVVAADAAVLDRHGDGIHDLVVTGPAATAALLAALLAGEVVPQPSPEVRGLAGRRSAAAVGAVLGPAGRTATTRITRIATGGGEGPVAHLVTVVEHPGGLVAGWALRSGDMELQVLDDVSAVADLALVLLGAALDEVRT